jgi:hypothetical protein
MPDRDPHEVLGVDRGASPATIKAAWRRLARENHPDLTGSDPSSVRAATRRMAMINAAYEHLRDGPGGKSRRTGTSRAATNGATEPADLGSRARRGGGPPPPKPARPVTGRVDTTDTFRFRNRSSTPRSAHARAHASAEPPPIRPAPEDREPPRASDPSGPLRRGRVRSFRAPPLPELGEAQALEMAFGKFRGHTLGEIAAFEPSYIDWIASTISRDAGLVAAARAVVVDLDRRGIVRRRRETDRERREGERRRREWQRIVADETGT